MPRLYVINLDESTQRLASIDAEMRGFGLEYVRTRATNVAELAADALPLAYDVERNRRRYFIPLKQTEIACFTSHLRTWQQIARGAERGGAIVLEDDISFTGDPRPVIAALAGWMDSDEARIVKLYAKRKSATATDTTTGVVTYRPLLPPLGLVAQYINRAAAQALIAHADAIWEPVDVYVQRVWVHGVDIRVVRDNLVREVSEQLGGTTLVQRVRRPWHHKLRRELQRPLWRSATFVRAVLHRARRRPTRVSASR